MSGERSAEQIQRDIERSRTALARTVDQLAYRTSPKRVSANLKQGLKAKATSTQGQVVLGATGLLVVVLVVRRFRKR